MLRVLLTIGAVQVATMLVLLARTKILAVMLGPESVGVMAVIDKLLAVIVGTVSLSLPFAAVRFARVECARVHPRESDDEGWHAEASHRTREPHRLVGDAAPPGRDGTEEDDVGHVPL